MTPTIETRELSTVAPKDDFLMMVERVTCDPTADIGKLERLLEMRERYLKQQAEIAFNSAMKEAQAEMEPIVRDAENSHTKSKYARLETIDAKIRPVYTKHGFSLTFNAGEPREKGAVRILCDVRHTQGYCKPYELEGDLDTAGAKGASNKTSIQGLGSSVSYLRRYLTVMIFNLALANEDNDGGGGGNRKLITEEQALTVYDMLTALEFSEQQMRAFLSWAGITRVEAIQQSQFEQVISALKKKLAVKEGR